MSKPRPEEREYLDGFSDGVELYSSDSPAPPGIPGFDWKLSKETQQVLAELDFAERIGPLRARDILVG